MVRPRAWSVPHRGCFRRFENLFAVLMARSTVSELSETLLFNSRLQRDASSTYRHGVQVQRRLYVGTSAVVQKVSTICIGPSLGTLIVYQVSPFKSCYVKHDAGAHNIYKNIQLRYALLLTCDMAVP